MMVQGRTSDAWYALLQLLEAQRSIEQLACYQQSPAISTVSSARLMGIQ